MFKYLINGELVTFNSPEERESGLNEAATNNYSIERVSLDYEKEKPKKKEEEKDPILASIEANNPKEDFTQDPAKSADAVSETVAQVGMELPPEDGSLDLQEKEEYNNIEGIEVTSQEYDDYQSLITSRENSKKDEEIIDLLGGEIVEQNNTPVFGDVQNKEGKADFICLLYTSPSPRDRTRSRMPSSA